MSQCGIQRLMWAWWWLPFGFGRKAFIQRYSKYVMQRAKTFTSCFEEMKVIGDGEVRKQTPQGPS
jgi:hypothetical protein